MYQFKESNQITPCGGKIHRKESFFSFKKYNNQTILSNGQKTKLLFTSGLEQSPSL